MSAPQLEGLNRLLPDFKSKNDAVRLHAAEQLHELIQIQQRDITSEQFAEYYLAITQQINQLIVHAVDNNERLAGVLALDTLNDFDGYDAATKTVRFLNSIRNVMRTTDSKSIRAAAHLLGKLAIPGGAVAEELVQSEIVAALEWLQTDRQESKRLAAVLIIQELANSAPTLVYQSIPQIFDLIWIPLRDSKEAIRREAAVTVGQCLQILQDREAESKDRNHMKLWDEALQGIRSGSPDQIHASLLVLRTLLQNGGMFVHAKFREANEIVSKLKEHRDPLIRIEVVNIIPVLAHYEPAQFAKDHLKTFMMYLLHLLSRERERNRVLLAIGQVAHAVESAMAPYLDKIVVTLRVALSVEGRQIPDTEEAVFQCICDLAVATGQTLSKYMEAMLDAIFACPLSESLTQALTDMAHYIAPIKPRIQEKLLDMLSIVLSGRPFKPLGAPVSGLVPHAFLNRDTRDPVANAIQEHQIKLALLTFGRFDFTGYILNEFVRDVAIKYTEDVNPVIREASAMTCCQLFVRDPIVFQTSSLALQVVSEVLEKLLVVAVADPEATIRQKVLESINARFDRHLAKTECIRSLFLAVNDEVFAVREAAIKIIGRLTHVNPAYVAPSLRKTLHQLLTQIEYSTITQSKEDSCKLISSLVGAAGRQLRPVVNALIRVLLPKIWDENLSLVASALGALGQLAAVAGSGMETYIPTLMPRLIQLLQEQTSPVKRHAALTCLAQLASCSGYVIRPYEDYPELLPLLVTIIRTEQTGLLRAETIRVFGILGAQDPYKTDTSTSETFWADQHLNAEKKSKILENAPEIALRDQASKITDISMIMEGNSPQINGGEKYYPTVAMNALLHILNDTSLAPYHSAAIDAVMNIYKTLGLKCVEFLSRVVQAFVNVIHHTSAHRVDVYFNQLSTLVAIVRQHIRNHLTPILDLVHEYWTRGPQVQARVLQLVEAVAKALEGEFKTHFAKLVPLMLDVLQNDNTPQRKPTERILKAFLVFRTDSEHYVHVLLPQIIRIFENKQQPREIRKVAIDSIAQLSRNVNLSDFSSSLILPLTRTLSSKEVMLRHAAIDAISALGLQLGYEFIQFVPLVERVMRTQGIKNPGFERLVNKLRKGEALPQDLTPDPRFDDDIVSFADVSTQKLTGNQPLLQKAWDTKYKTTRDDWLEWSRRLNGELLKESSSPALRACAALASAYPPLARELFNSAFYSCYFELPDDLKSELMGQMERALSAPSIPPEITHMVLNLAEFMEHDDQALPIDIRILGKFAGKVHSFAKALHYKELEYLQEPTIGATEALIHINNYLQQSDAAKGILRNANQLNLVVRESWLEKLGQWEEALEMYEAREQKAPTSFEVIMGKMKCFHALGESEYLSELANARWRLLAREEQKLLAPLATAASWATNQWERMDDYLKSIKSGSPDHAFYAAILAIQRNQFDAARNYIVQGREGLDTELTTLLSESYTRAYTVVLRVQLLAELEEIIEYKQCDIHDVDRKSTMQKTWMKRLKGSQKSVEAWQRMLNIRSLVLQPREDVDMWISFTNLCRKSGKQGLADKALRSLMIATRPGVTMPADDTGFNVYNNVVPEIWYAQLKAMWSKGEKREALQEIARFNKHLSTTLSTAQNAIAQANNAAQNASGATMNGNFSMHTMHDLDDMDGQAELPSQEKMEERSKLLSRAWLKQGEWQSSTHQGDWVPERIRAVIYPQTRATRYNAASWKAWHSLATAHFRIVTAVTSAMKRENRPLPDIVVLRHVVPAMEAFFKAIALSQSSALQDTLRILTLWFAHGAYREVNEEVSRGFGLVKMEIWLSVVPQLVARINVAHPTIREAVQKLLMEVGRAHPQALVFPLTVAHKSTTARKSRSAGHIMDTMRSHSPLLIDQADLVSGELVRVAVLWHELWHEALEDASRIYFVKERDVETVRAMNRILEPFHRMLDIGPTTTRETSFFNTYAAPLEQARQLCHRFLAMGSVKDIDAAWDTYYIVFNKIGKQLGQMTEIELSLTSPRLNEARDLSVAIPGTYEPGGEIVTIEKFMPIFTIISSKQRPRKLSIRGSNGHMYQYLLKGHEDMRQDERLMQLFGLVNTLLQNSPECHKRHFNIQRYPVIPLSPSSGLLGWVPNSDTLHQLIREYRDQRKLLINIEHRLMIGMAPDYDHLTLMQKIEVFSYGLENTTGQDLYRVLWLKSKSSESWLERRTNYTRSLGVMSMVGYVLGLGDRHPSNLMLDKITGNIIHIDFGDCFEVAMHRDKYPEKVPFRLTRMLTYAMEVGGVDGSFRITCELVMNLLRDNRESLMAVLEAFLHDPLMHWRLNQIASPSEIDVGARSGVVAGTQESNTAAGADNTLPAASPIEPSASVVKSGARKIIEDADRPPPLGRDGLPDPASFQPGRMRASKAGPRAAPLTGYYENAATRASGAPSQPPKQPQGQAHSGKAATDTSGGSSSNATHTTNSASMKNSSALPGPSQSQAPTQSHLQRQDSRPSEPSNLHQPLQPV